MDEIIGEMDITFPTDAEGLTGRQCPNPECGRYFKVRFGTGVQAEIPCTCPYCGHRTSHDEFFTDDQIGYADSIVINKATEWLLRSVKELEVKPDPRAMFSLGIEVEGQPEPVRHYSEKDLEQIVVCDKCGLHYAIYGAFGYCPDCGVHNSLQILKVSLTAVNKTLALVGHVDADVARTLVENALEDAVASFDGFGREITTVHVSAATDSRAAGALSFQSIEGARVKVEALFAIRLNDGFSDDEWADLTRAFQKRHVLAHKMGVMDQRYIDATGESAALLGRRVEVTKDEVRSVCRDLVRVGSKLASGLGVT